MSDDEKKNEDISTHTKEYYEAVASQDQTYMDEVEENLRAMLTKANSSPRAAESLHEELDQAAEELITGDSDDAPLSEEAVVEALGMTLNTRRSDGYDR